MSKKSVKDLILKLDELPPLNMVAKRLLEVSRKGESSASKITEILSSDQAIATKVLEMANSSTYGFSRKISTISHAVVVLGNKTIENLALGFSAVDFFKDYHSSISPEEFWEHSLAVATASQVLATRLHYPEPEEAMIAGLLHDVGQLMLGTFFPDDYKKVLESDKDFVEEEKEILGLSHCRTGSLLLEKWELPAHLCEAVRLHHFKDLKRINQNDLLRIIVAGEFLTIIKGKSFLDNYDNSMVWAVINSLGIPTQEYNYILTDIEKRIEASQRLFHHKSKLAGTSELEMGNDKVFAVVGSDTQRLTWIRSILKHFGLKSISIAVSNLEALEKDNYDFVIIDPSGPEGLKAKQAVKNCAAGKKKYALVYEGDVHRRPKTIPTLPFAFNVPQLNRAFTD